MRHLTHLKPHPLSLSNPGLSLRRPAHRNQKLLLERGIILALPGELGDDVETVLGVRLQRKQIIDK